VLSRSSVRSSGAYFPAATSAVMEAALKGARIPTAYLTAGAIGVAVIAAAVLFVLIRKKKKA